MCAMQMTLLTVTVPTGPSLSEDEREKWLEVLENALEVRRTPLTRIKSPFEATVELGDAPEESRVVIAVMKAFRAVGVTEGQVDVALSEHDEDDPDLETPPF